MPNQQIPISIASGLQVQANSFTVPDGSFELAENVVFSKDNIISKRRGFGELTPALNLTSPTGLIDYLGYLFVSQNNLLSRVDATTGALTSLSGTLTISAGAKPRAAKANGNLYIATSAGLRKLESSSGTITQAGIPRGLDLDVSLNASLKTGILAPNKAVGYRILFGRLDANSNKVTGAPSEISTKTNPYINGSTPAAASNAGTTVTVTYTSHGLIVGDSVVIANSTGTIPPDGTWTVATVPTTGTFTFVSTSAPVSLTTCNFGVYRTPILEWTLPPEVTSSYFYQVFRTSQVGITSTVADDGSLIYEANSSGSTSSTFTDTIDDLFKDGYLYTNSSQQGIARSNFRPPFAADIAVFSNCLFFANTQSYQTKSIALKSVTSAAFIAGDYIEISCTSVRRYIATTTPPTTGVVSGSSTSAVWSYGATNASGYSYFLLTNSSSTSVSSSITATTKSLSKAINRDASGEVYSYYLSSGDSVPGQFTLEARNLSASAFKLLASVSRVGDNFSPVLPTSFVSGTQVTSSNSIEQNAVSFSKPSEPEACPIPYKLLVGAKTSAVLRIVPLRDALLVLKSDGVYVIRGDSPNNFSVQLLDSTIICVAADSVCILNNNVFFLSNQGIVSVSDTGAQVISRPIEPLFTAIIGNTNIATATNAVSYESERLYLLSTLAPNSSTASVVYCFNTVTNAFSTWTNTFEDAIVNPTDDKLYTLGTSISKERKLQNRLDYTELSYSGTSGTVTSSTKCELSFATGTPAVGDSVYEATTATINQILSISTASGTPVYTFKSPLAWVAAGALVLYKPIRSSLRLAPLTMGDVSRVKQFSEFVVNFRNRSCSALTLSFANDTSLSSTDTTWAQDSAVQTGWGFGYGSIWGGESIDSVLTTQGSQPARTYIPLEASRGTFIQAVVVHNVAAENIEIQSFAYTARSYAPRSSK